MQGDSVHAIEGLSRRVAALKTSELRIDTLRGVVESDLAMREAELAEVMANMARLDKVVELFRALMDAMLLGQVQSVEGVVTEGLRTVFFDQNLSFESTVGPKYGKIAVDFLLRQGDKSDPLSYSGYPLESFGGGPASLASLILRILAVLRLKRYPLLVLDEALGAVSEEYSDQTASFLQQLAREVGVDILLVTQTQKQTFCDYADRSYRCSEVTEGGRKHLDIQPLRKGST